MDRQRRRFYVIVGLAVAYGLLLIWVFLFKREALFSPPFVFALLALAFVSALVMLFKSKRAGKYRTGFLLKATGLFLAIAGAISTRTEMPSAIGVSMTLSGVFCLALGSHFVLKTAKEEAKSQGSGRSENPSGAP